MLVYSTSKGLAAMTLALAHSRGWLDYDERVATYWPEFAQRGKERVTVRDPIDGAALANARQRGPWPDWRQAPWTLSDAAGRAVVLDMPRSGMIRPITHEGTASCEARHLAQACYRRRS